MASVFPLQGTTELALRAFFYMQDSAFGCEQKKKKKFTEEVTDFPKSAWGGADQIGFRYNVIHGSLFVYTIYKVFQSVSLLS